MVEQIIPNIARLWSDGLEIMHIEFFHRIDITDSEALDYKNACINLARGKPRLVLVDLRDMEYLTPGAFKQLTGPELSRLTKAAAILLKSSSPLVATGISLLIKLEHEPFPIQVFTDEKEAIDWLKKFESQKWFFLK